MPPRSCRPPFLGAAQASHTSIINGQPSSNPHSPQTPTSISSLFKHFQIRKAEIPSLPCYTCA